VNFQLDGRYAMKLISRTGTEGVLYKL